MENNNVSGRKKNDKKRESIATIALAVGTTILCILLLAIPQKKAADDGHGHGAAKEHDEKEVPGIDIDAEEMTAANMEIAEVGPVKITPKITTRGQIKENANFSMNVKPRFGGIVKSVAKDFGDTVKKGDVLLTIESASTRATYTVRSTVNGIVADKKVVAGSFVPEGESILRVIDLTTVWFYAKVPIFDAQKLKSGSRAKVSDHTLGVSGDGKIIYVSPVVEEDTQTSDVRIEIANLDSNWRVGSFAEAELYLDEIEVALAVKTAAIQNLNGQPVVFMRTEDRLVPVPVKIGRVEGDLSEILTGVAVGEKYLATNSFLAKAELLKSTAEHEH